MTTGTELYCVCTLCVCGADTHTYITISHHARGLSGVELGRPGATFPHAPGALLSGGTDTQTTSPHAEGILGASW